MVVALLLVGGCSSAQTRYYLLSAMPHPEPAQRAVSQASPMHLEIAAIQLPPYLDRQQLVTRERDHQIAIAHTDLWGGHLRRNIARVMAENLAQLSGWQVSIAPHAAGSRIDVQLQLEIQSFERQSDGRVRLHGSWQLVDVRRNAVRKPAMDRVHSGERHDVDLYSGEVRDAAGQVAAMSALLATLSHRIASALPAMRSAQP